MTSPTLLTFQTHGYQAVADQQEVLRILLLSGCLNGFDQLCFHYSSPPHVLTHPNLTRGITGYYKRKTKKPLNLHSNGLYKTKVERTSFTASKEIWSSALNFLELDRSRCSQAHGSCSCMANTSDKWKFDNLKPVNRLWPFSGRNPTGRSSQKKPGHHPS